MTATVLASQTLTSPVAQGETRPCPAEPRAGGEVSREQGQLCVQPACEDSRADPPAGGPWATVTLPLTPQPAPGPASPRPHATTTPTHEGERPGAGLGWTLHILDLSQLERSQKSFVNIFTTWVSLMCHLYQPLMIFWVKSYQLRNDY